MKPPEERSRRLLEADIPRLLLSFSAPAILGMLANALYYLIDRIFVGRAVGAAGIAGITVAFPVMLVLMAFGMLIGFGATTLVSIRLGEKKHDEAERVLGCALFLMLVTSLALTALALAGLDPLLRLFGASETLLPYSRDYTRVMVLGTLVQMVCFGLNAIIRGEGNPAMAMITMLVSVALNAVLAPVFLFWCGWGMKGAAWATLLSQAVSAVWVLAHFLGKRSVLKLRAGNLRLDRPLARAILTMGLPPFAMQIAASLTNSILFNQLRTYGGDDALSIMGMIHAAIMVIAMPIIGINQGAQPIMGYNYGARRYDRVRTTLRTAILAATVIAVGGFAVVMVFPARLFALFGAGAAALVEPGCRALRLCLMMLPTVGFQIVSAGYFQAVGKPRQAMLLTLSRQVLLLIPAVLILPRLLGLDGVWASLPSADVLSALWTAYWLVLELRNLGRQHRDQAAIEPGPAPA